MKYRIFTKSLLFLALCGGLSSCHQNSEDSSIIRLRTYKKSLVEAYQNLGLFKATNIIPGLTVAVSIDNQLVWADGFGYSNLEFKVKALPFHKFRIGQVSELVTGLTAAKLYEEGLLQIDKPVSEYLPELFGKDKDYTIRQLSAHTAGIRNESSVAGTDKDNSLQKIIPTFINDSLIFEPGNAYVHSELGIDMMAYIMEKTRKEEFEKIVKNTLLDTLKLTGTTPDNPYQIIENRSSTYDFNYISQPVVASFIDLRGKEASAGYLSSVLDLVKMGNTILYPGYLKQKTIDLMTTPFKLQSGKPSLYGFGLISSKDNDGHIFYGQQGSVGGGCAALLIYPDDKMVIAIAANISSETLQMPVFEIASIFRKQLHPEEQKGFAK